MKIRISACVFVRHKNNLSVVWCPRTSGCTVLRNAQSILDEIGHEWGSLEEIVQKVAAKFDCTVDEAHEGVELVVKELLNQRFVEAKDAEDSHLVDLDNGKENGVVSDVNRLTIGAYHDTELIPLGDFYGRHGLPFELHIDLTNACNEKCVHCYLPHGGAHFLETDLAFKSLKEFREAKGLTVYFSGGECMLHRDFAKILRYAKSLDLNIIIMSNLTLCDKKTVALLKEIDPQFVNVSLYAVTESIHDAITLVSGSCRRTKEAIDALQAAGVHIRIATPFMRENKGCVEELKRFAAKRRIHLIADSEIFGQLDHSCANQCHALSMYELTELMSSNRDVFDRGSINLERCTPSAKVCDIGDWRLNLDAEGRYYPCDGFHGVIIGDARKDSLLEVWSGDALNRLRALKNKDFGSCTSCLDRAWCKVCPMRNFNETGDMFTHAPWRCEATRIYKRIFEEK